MKSVSALLIVFLIVSFIFTFVSPAVQYDPEVYRVQKALRAQGYDPGPLDVQWGRPTRNAVEQFQKDSGLPITVTLDQQTKTKKAFTNSLGMKFVRIPAGSFMMGSRLSADEVARKYGTKAEYHKNEHPQHSVRISKAFYLQVTEVTVGQWRRFIRETGYKTEVETLGVDITIWTGSKWEKRKGIYWDNPTRFKQDDSHAVTLVSWNDVQQFIKWINRKEGGSRYRLPTEAEWEYAARADTQTVRFWGDDANAACRYANVHDQTSRRVNKFANWENHNCDDKYAVTAPTASFKPNGFGLYDMLGNVWEWCGDWYGEYTPGSVTDPRGPSGGSYRVRRGGSWISKPRFVRCAMRGMRLPDYTTDNLGFRLLRTK